MSRRPLVLYPDVLLICSGESITPADDHAEVIYPQVPQLI